MHRTRRNHSLRAVVRACAAREKPKGGKSVPQQSSELELPEIGGRFSMASDA